MSPRFAEGEPDIFLRVFGEPGVAGNKTAFAFKRGDGTIGARVVEGGKSKGRQERARTWRERITAVAQELAEEGAPMLDGPLEASVVFYVVRPKSKPAHRFPFPHVRPDFSKYLRALEDPLTGVLIVDDSRIVWFSDSGKLYADPPDQRPRAEVRLWRIPDAAGGSEKGGPETQHYLQLDCAGPVRGHGEGGGEVGNDGDPAAGGRSCSAGGRVLEVAA